ncbi:MAG: 3-oxoacyl-[acyl-carrier-protein] synthase III C-terminal domain-containing protein [Candidatus Acidiferrales bacterium]
MTSAEHLSGNGRQPAIVATSTAVPGHLVSREQVKAHMQRVFLLDGARLDGMMSIVDNSFVKQRYTIFPLEYTIEPRPLTQTNLEYQEHAIKLGEQVTKDCLERAGMKPEDIDWIITVSCTGFMIPSLEAYLIENMGFRRDVRRLPITELGCAAGAAAFARAHEFLKAGPGKNVLLVAVELPSLTFQRRSFTQANIISSILFGDGAAAAIISSEPRNGPQILATETYLFPKSHDAMGFDLREDGFHIFLSKDVPDLIRGKIKGLVDSFLLRQKLERKDIAAFVLHPGGRKLMDYMEEELSLCRHKTEPSWDVLSEYGNLSSASVLFVLDDWLKKKHVADGQYGLMAAFGPGFSAELLLLRWA